MNYLIALFLICILILLGLYGYRRLSIIDTYTISNIVGGTASQIPAGALNSKVKIQQNNDIVQKGNVMVKANGLQLDTYHMGKFNLESSLSFFNTNLYGVGAFINHNSKLITNSNIQMDFNMNLLTGKITLTSGTMVMDLTKDTI
jgi:hypothetical protein